MEGLRPRQQKAQNDRPGRRIPTSVPAAYVAAWLCAHPPFRLSVRTATARVHAVSRQLLAEAPRPRSPTPTTTPPPPTTWPCPCCGGTMLILEKLTAQQIR